MSKHFPATLSLLLSSVMVGAIACSPNRATSPDAPVPISTPTIAPVAPSAPSPVQTSQNSGEDSYKLGLEKVSSAQNLRRAALTEDDWKLVASRWQQAIALLKSVPATSTYSKMAKTKLAESETGLTAAQKQVNQVKTASDSGLKPSLIAGGAETLNVTSGSRSSPEAGKVYRVPIKRRAGGTPIIDVTFNGNQTFEMIVDTGASGTVITQAMAQALNVQVIGKTKVNTASQAGVEVPLGYVSSIAVGSAVVKEVIVAIGNDALPIGLLGHDFFDNYDVTIKQDVVEFKKR